LIAGIAVAFCPLHPVRLYCRGAIGKDAALQTNRIIDVHRRSGDANIGQTLIRLARLAEANHQFQTVQSMDNPLRSVQAEVERIDLGPAVLSRPGFDHNGSGSAHKEVSR
jgi:hypothetical protein